jgi:inner membrane protein
MPSPIGHSLAGYVIYRAIAVNRARSYDWQYIALCILAANAPDLDFIPGLIVGDLGRYHHGPSHSLFFGVVFAIVLSIFCLRRLYIFLIAFTLYSSHLLLDYFVKDPSFPHGVPLFWPFSDEYYMASFAFLRGVKYQPDLTESIQQVLLRGENVITIFTEVLFLLPLLLFILLRDKIGRSSKNEPSSVGL